MKSIILSALIFTQLALAQDVNCDPKDPAQQILKLASDISLPNCVNEANIFAAKSNDTSKLCGECKTLFESRNDSTLVPLSKEERQSLFVEAALKEYKKSITNSLVDTLKIRSLRPTGSDFKASAAACKMKTKADLPKSCSPAAIKIIEDKKLLSDLDKEVSNELAKIISTDKNFSPNPTLLKRSAPKCDISEKDALYISSAASEESFSPAMIKALLALDPSKFRTTSSMFINDKVSDEYDGEVSELFSYLSNHPLMGDHFKTPTSLVNFLKTIPEPKDTNQLRSTIYNKKSGDEFDAKMSSACIQSFDALVKNICAEDFEKGNFELSAFANESKILKEAIKPSEEQLASNDKLIKLNTDVLKLCESPQNSKIKFSNFDTEINISLPARYQSLNLEEFKLQKFDSDIGNMSNNICLSKDKTCEDNSILCKMISKFKAISDPQSLDFKLANSSNREVNQLLRSMIGDTSKIDPKTKEILIAQGIIPKDDGTMVVQPEIPERQPEYFAKEQTQQPQNGATIAKAAPSNVSNSSSTGRNPASSNNNFVDEGYSNSNTAASSNTLPDFSDLMDDQQELRGIQDEIKRRLLGMPENRPANLNDAKRIARESFKSRGRRISPEEETAFASRMMERPEASVPQTAASTFQNTPANTDNRAAVSGGESANSKWRKGQDQAALMGMQGAQSALGKESANTPAAADNKPKDMTKVALNIADDPQVTLSDMFNKKIDQNDPETQLLKVLLRNKNNFLLQIKSMNFKIVFDGNNFNLLLESGDRQEAARIRPQLEMFLKKLKK